jgi:tetratricopeptide (TPR) repeat protein
MSRLLPLWLALVVVAATAGVWWWLRPAAVNPPNPEGIQDAELRQAIDEARQQVFEHPDNAEVWGHLGCLFLAHLFSTESNQCFIEAGRLDPSDPRWPYNRALMALKLQPNIAVDLLKQTLALASVDEAWSAYRSSACLMLAEALLERSRIEEAASYFEQEQARNPMSKRAALGLGQIAAVRGDEPRATKLLMLARDSPAATRKATALLASLARGRGDKASAEAFEKELATMPQDRAWPDPTLDAILGLEVGQRGRERRIMRLEHQKRYGEAAALYLDALQDHPTLENYRGAGVNLSRVGKYDRGIPLLRKCVDLAPDSAHDHFSLALALVQLAEAQGATQDASKVTDVLREAVVHARRAAELKPDHAGAYLLWGRSLYYLGEVDAAIAPLSKAVAYLTTDFNAQFALAEAYLKTGNLSAAEEHFENARRLAPDHPLPVEHLKTLRAKKK